MITEAAGHGWQFVPAPGVLPLPRELAEDEYYPLHVALWDSKRPEHNCEYGYPHKHLMFMGDDGIASVWAPIESKPFLDYVLNWIRKSGEYFYGAGVEHITKALVREREELANALTPREQALMHDEAKWQRSVISAWCMLA